MHTDKKTASRLNNLRSHFELSQRSFAGRVGITQGALSQLEAGNTALSLPTIQKICEEFHVDCNWLILGEGSLVEAVEPVHNISKDTKAMTELDNDSWVKRAHLIPLIAEEAQAGYIKQCHEPEYIEALDVYRIPGFDKGNHRMFEIEGDSMVPTFSPGEIVVVEHCEDWSLIRNGELAVVICEDGVLAKRVMTYKDDKDTFLMKSDNLSYKTFALEKKEIKEIWLIKAKITNDFDEELTKNKDRITSIESDLLELKEKMSKLAKEK